MELLGIRCSQFAKFAHEKGHQVNIIFIEDGTLRVDNTRDFEAKTVTGDCPDDDFSYWLAHDVPVGV